MGRKADVGYWHSKKGYYTTYKGQRYRLRSAARDDSPDGPDYLAALQAFVEIVTGPAARPASDRLHQCVERWVAHQARSNPTTARITASMLRPVVQVLGQAQVGQLRPAEVLGAIEARPSWSPATKGHALARLRSCLRWNRETGHTALDPLASLRRPDYWRPRSRGAECLLPDELVRLLLASAAGRWRDYLRALSRTGARPGELAGARLEAYRPDDHALILSAHKTAKRRAGPDVLRTIMLDAQVERRIRRNAGGPSPYLLPTRRGRMWSPSRRHHQWRATLAIADVSAWLSARWAHPRPPILYGFRHSYVTKHLLKGTPIKLLAEWCGTSVAMIERHYAHVAGDPLAARRAFLAYV